MAEFHKPTHFAGHEFSAFQGGSDPAQVNLLAHESARALMSRVRSDGDEALLQRVVSYSDENGLDALVELWAHSSAHSLPGALWRLYLLREAVQSNPEYVSHIFEVGRQEIAASLGNAVTEGISVDSVIAGAPTPLGPDEVRELADTILRGAFSADFEVALDRAAACCRILAAGALHDAEASELLNPKRTQELTQQSARYLILGAELSSCARLWHDKMLD